VVGLIFLVNQLLTRKYLAPFYQNKTSIVFGEGERKIPIDDLDEVTMFRTTIINSEDISAHHTYSIDEIRFFFPDEASNIYRLGRDSENEGEFWLTAAGRLGSIYLKQFRSEPLGEFATKVRQEIRTFRHHEYSLLRPDCRRSGAPPRNMRNATALGIAAAQQSMYLARKIR
jgi:hypothetical protein